MERDVLVIGEALVDVVRDDDGSSREYAGGSAANVAVALARLERPVRFATGYADDRLGSMVALHLESAGVVLATDPHVVERTSTAVATIAADGSASYVFDLEWRLGPVPVEPAPLVAHACSLGAVLAPGADDVLALLRSLRPATTISYDVNARPAIAGTGPDLVARVEQVASVADLVKASDEDLAALYPSLPLEDAAARLLALGPAAVAVTQGGGGAFWLDRTGRVDVSARRVEVADTIGAGDTFGAGLIDALWTGGRLDAAWRDDLRDLPRHEVRSVLAHAAAAAAITVSRPGADPPYRSELSASLSGGE